MTSDDTVFKKKTYILVIVGNYELHVLFVSEFLRNQTGTITIYI